MNTFIRLMLVLALAAGLFLLARESAAWAEGSPEQSLSAPEQGNQSFVDRKDDDCNRGWGKDKEKDKHKCKDKGSVKPPPKHVVIPVTGRYSVGGFCTLDIELNDPAIILNASIETPLPREIPNDAQKVRQGCLLEYYSADQRIDGLPAGAGSATICFAAMPNKQMTLYFYNLYAPNPTWVPLETSTQAGLVCAPGNETGLYVATFLKH
jgi:hypothetical protein